MLAIIQKLRNVKKEYLALAFFAALVLLFYGNTLQNGFVHDDVPVIAENPYVHDLRYLPKVVTGCIWEPVLGSCKGTTLHYRPMQTFSFLLTWQISSAPWFFHLVNVAYFLIAVFLVFLLAKTITGKFILSFFAALLFLIYPIHSENVNWIVAIVEPLSAIFISLAIINYINYRKENSPYNFVLALLFFFLALLTKEMGLLLPVIFFAVDYLLLKKGLKELISKKELKKYLLLAGPFLVYFLMRTMALGGFGGIYRGGESPMGAFSLIEKIYVYFGLFAGYLQKIFFPYPVPMFFLDSFQIKNNLFNVNFAAYIAVFFLYCSAAAFLIKKNKFLVFCLIWFLVFIFVPIAFFKVAGEKVLAERYLFVPSIGFALIFGYCLNYFWERKIRARIIILIFITILAIVSWLLIFPQNRMWRDTATVFESVLSKNPDAYPVRWILSNFYRKTGNMEQAKEQWEYLIKEKPDWDTIDQIYNSLGQYWRDKKDFDRAREYFEKAVSAAERNKTYNYKSYNNLGALLMEKGDYLGSIIGLCGAMRFAPQAEEPQLNFNRLISLIDSVDEKELSSIYRGITETPLFQKSSEERIRYKQKSCSASSAASDKATTTQAICSFSFDSRFGSQDIILPFLILGSASDGKVLRVQNPSFNPGTGEVVLGIDKAYQNKSLTFIFPTCQGLYYQANTE